jgi:hypothetical protein
LTGTRPGVVVLIVVAGALAGFDVAERVERRMARRITRLDA